MMDARIPGETYIANTNTLASINEKIVAFGKFKGSRACDVVADKPDYVIWARNNVEFAAKYFNDRDLAAARKLAQIAANKQADLD